MQIFLYSLDNWQIPDSTFNVFGDTVIRETGPIDMFLPLASKHKPNIIFLQGFDATEELIAIVNSLQNTLPKTVIIPHCTQLDSWFLLRLMRQGIREVLTNDSIDAIQDVLKRAHDYLRGQSNPNSKKSEVIGLISSKGGDGTSFLTANLGFAIAKDGEGKVLAIDLSIPFGDLDMFLTNKTCSHNLFHFTAEIDRIDEPLLESMAHHVNEKFHFIPAPISLEEALKLNPAQIQKLISIAKNRYKYVVLDLGNQINSFSISVLENLDNLVIVAANNMPSIRRTSQILRLWEGIGRSLKDTILLINRYEIDSDLDVNQISKAVGKEVLETLPEDRLSVEEALFKGIPLLQFKPKSPLAISIHRWASYWTGKLPKEGRSIWHRLKTK